MVNFPRIFNAKAHQAQRTSSPLRSLLLGVFAFKRGWRMVGAELGQRLWHGLRRDLGSFRAAFSELTKTRPRAAHLRRAPERRAETHPLPPGRRPIGRVVCRRDRRHSPQPHRRRNGLLCPVRRAPKPGQRRPQPPSPPQDRPQMQAELAQMYTMVARFREPGTGCPTCAIQELAPTLTNPPPSSAIAPTRPTKPI
jgi:hypothetical protein